MPDTFRCTLVTPEQQVLDAEVTQASIPAWDGQIGLLHQHAPLLAKLGYGPLKLDVATGGTRWFYVGGGFAQMKDNKLSLVTSEAVPAEEISRADAEAALKEAQARIARSDDEVQRVRRDTTRARAMIALAAHKA